MLKQLIVGFVVVLSAGVGLLAFEDPQAESAKVKEHEWLQQWVGEWESEMEMTMVPGQPPMKMKGTESTRSLGGIWIVAENKGETPGGPMMAILTLGYDPEKKKYVGTWVDSMTTHMWNYEGSLDALGKILTLDTEGPNMLSPGKRSKYKDVTEFKSKDHKVLTSSMLGDDGKWVTIVTVNYRRKS